MYVRTGLIGPTNVALTVFTLSIRYRPTPPKLSPEPLASPVPTYSRPFAASSANAPTANDKALSIMDFHVAPPLSER